MDKVIKVMDIHLALESRIFPENRDDGMMEQKVKTMTWGIVKERAIPRMTEH
jgi:hypothetical protein